jgi:glutathione S-transferase
VYLDLSVASAEPEILLYGQNLTPYTVKVARGLCLKKLPFRLIEPTSREDYRRFNPETGMLPVIEIDGERIIDSAAILDFLDERFPVPPFLSDDPRVAREQRQLEAWIGETFDFYIMRWIRSRVLPPDPDPETAKIGFGEMSRLGLIGDDGQLRAEVFDTTHGGPGPEFERRLDDLLNILGRRPYFFGDRPSRADIAVFATFYGMYRDLFPGSRALLERRPALLRYVARVETATGGPDAGRGGSLDGRSGGSPP